MVRRKVQRLPEAVGPRQGQSGAGPVLRLLIMGDSSAAGVGVVHQDDALAGQLVAALGGYDLRWHLEARTGATTAHALAGLRALPPTPFDAAVVVLGVNDVIRQVPLRRWLAEQRALWEVLESRFGLRHIYLSGVPPLGRFPALPQPLRALLGARARLFDTALAAEVARRPSGQAVLHPLPFDTDTLDPALMAVDGFHPGREIYRDWAGLIAGAIRADFA